MPQSSFEFQFGKTLQEEDFIVSESNRQAVLWIEKWPDWNQNIVLIYGPKGCGKTLLAYKWQALSQACFVHSQDIYHTPALTLLGESKCCIVEDIETVNDEAALLHFFNAVKEAQGWLLMTTHHHPSNTSIRLPDLKSRLLAVPSIGVSAPDEELLKALFTKEFADRQLKVAGDVIEFLVARMERSFEALHQIVDTLDQQALDKKRNITIPFVKQVVSLFD